MVYRKSRRDALAQVLCWLGEGLALGLLVAALLWFERPAAPASAPLNVPSAAWAASELVN